MGIKYTLKQYQDLTLEIMTEIDRVCRKNKINYSLGYGTLIGAMRHKGYIPWDDDIDVIFTREAYDRFLQVADQLDPKFEVIKPNHWNNKYLDDITRIVYKGTQIEDPTELTAYYEEVRNQCFVDVFVMDDTKKGSTYSRQKFTNQRLYGYAISRRPYTTLSKAPRFKDRFLARIAITLGKLHNLDKTLAKKDKNARKYNGKPGYDCKACFNGYPVTGVALFPKKWFENYIDVEFEGHTFQAIADYDGFLTSMYGSWRELPPEDKRVPGHQSFRL